MMSKAQQRLQAQLCAALRRQVAGEASRVPEAGRELWGVFNALSEARSFHHFGPNPIPFAEIEAWARLMQVPLSPAHVAIIRAMDGVWLEAFFARQGVTRGGAKTLPPRSKQPLTAALFDAAMG